MYELANYYILGRILYFVPYHSPVHPGRVLTTFAAISMIVEALNGNGAAYTANQSLSEDKRNTGKALLKAALLMQIVIVVLFISLAVTFQLKCRRNGISSSKLNSCLTTLYISTTIITVRTIYRVVEYFSIASLDFSQFSKPGFDPTTLSPLIRYEWFFYVFEASLMLANSVLLNARHPRRYLPKSTKVYLAKDGVTEIMGPGYKQDRNFFATLVDPFDVYGMLKGRDKETRFWDQDGMAEGKSTVVPGSKAADGARGLTV